MNPPRFSKQAIAYVLLGCSVLLNIVLLATRASSPAPHKTSAQAAQAKPAAVPTVAAGPEVAAGDWKIVRTPLKSSPARSFAEAAPDDGDALSAVYARLFMWDVDMRHDLSNGDQMDVAYHLNEEGLPEIGAARLNAKKKAKTYHAYRWQAPGDKFASYWSEEGNELPLQLKNGPLTEYQQITSLLKDRPTHKGMDFKTPVGTEVRVPFAGTVVRSNWNWGANGNCVEVVYPDGTLAKFLHLSENRVKPGDKVEVGQVIALTGNTGHSTAPHLHYQLNQGEKVVDPIDYHGTVRRKLDDAAMVQFRPTMVKLDGLLAERTAGL